MSSLPFAKSPYPSPDEWILLGNGEFGAAEVLNNGESGLLRHVRHHCHRAVECYLKAFLASKDFQRKTHKLEDLLADCIGLDPAFRMISDPVNALARDFPPNLWTDSNYQPGQLGCESHVETCYNPQNTFDPCSASDWIAAVRKVQEFIFCQFGQEAPEPCGPV